MTLIRVIIVALAMALAACAPAPWRAGVPSQWRASPNFDERRPSVVIIHHTSDSTAAEALRTLTSPSHGVSAHYVIGRDGTIYQLVDERARAWHAGESYWRGYSDLNSSSLGIELDNNGEEPFAEAQTAALLALLADFKQRYGIPTANFIGHADVAPRRKVDPSRYFPWKTLAAHGFGLWCDPPYPVPPADLDPAIALQALGYEVSNMDAAIAAFKRHYVQNDSPPGLTEQERGLLYCLLTQRGR